jgi:hypothetical protein
MKFKCPVGQEPAPLKVGGNVTRDACPDLCRGKREWKKKAKAKAQAEVKA